MPAPELRLAHPVGATVQIVVDTLFARIKSEEYPRDTRLPSERTLAAELGVTVIEEDEWLRIAGQ